MILTMVDMIPYHMVLINHRNKQQIPAGRKIIFTTDRRGSITED